MRLLAIAFALPLAALLAAAGGRGAGDERRGEIAYRKCYACHAIEPGKNLEGPSLAGIVGRRIAAQPGFAYSPALRALAARHRRWTPALLDAFVADPEKVAPRSAMNFVGMRDARERADLISYLRRR